MKATSSLLMGTILVLEDGGRRKTMHHQCGDVCYQFGSGKGVIWSRQVEGGDRGEYTEPGKYMGRTQQSAIDPSTMPNRCPTVLGF